MSFAFSCPISETTRGSRKVLRMDVPLVALGARGPASHLFVFDSGCQITSVSEDVAAKLVLPDGGRAIHSHGVTGSAAGRVVDVRFRFPNTFAGAPGLEVASSWVVMSGRRELALLSLTEVHRHFQIRTFEFDTYFIPWATLPGPQ